MRVILSILLVFVLGQALSQVPTRLFPFQIKEANDPDMSLQSGVGGVWGQVYRTEDILWSADHIYDQNAVVAYNGALYKSLTNGNGNNIPSSSPTEWEAINTGGSGGGGIEARYDYASLRSSPPTDSLVVITHPDYFGIFRKAASGVENSGTVIKDSNDDYWIRLRQPGYFNLNWYEIGGPTEDSTIDAVDSYSDVIKSICAESGGGATVDLSGPNSPRTFLLDKRIDLKPYMTFIGKGDTLRRQDAFFTVITSAGDELDGEITVADTTGFRRGQRVTVTGYRSHAGVRISNKRILDIPDGNTIDLEGSIGGDVFVGDTVFLSFPMFRNGEALVLGDIKFEGIVFDGNWRGNPYTNSWSLNNTMNISNNPGSHLTVENCQFYDTPSENMIAASATIRDCQAEQLAGGFYHISIVPDTAFNVFIENVWVNNSNIATSDSTDHSEAVIVSSALPGNVKIYNSQFSNSAEALIGDFGGATDYWELINVRAENMKGVSLGGFGTESIEGLRIQDCTFINCRDLKVTAGDLLAGQVLVDAVITDNLFINTTVRIEGSRNLQFDRNQMLYEPAEGGFDDWPEKPYLDAMCYFSEFANLKFRNNSLRADTVALPGELEFAVVFDGTGVVNNTLSTDYYLGYGLDCVGNDILYFRRGITADTATTSNPAAGDNRRTRAYWDWNIQGNRVQMLPKGLGDSWGILAGPGVLIEGNTVYSSGDTTVTSIYPIFAYGVDDQGNAHQRIPGARVLRNTVIGPWDFGQTIHSIFIGGNVSSDQGGFNCEVKWNLTPTPISGGGAIQSPAISILLYNELISDELPAMILPSFPPPLDYQY